MKIAALGGALALAASTVLSGCNQPSGIEQFIQEIQADAVAICGFEPEFATIVGIAGAFVPGVTAAVPIAQEICAAATAIKARHAFGSSHAITVTVHGVRVTGHFVR